VPLEEIDFFQDQCSEIRPRRRPPRSGQTEPTVATSTPSPAGSAVRRLNPASIRAWTKQWTCPVLLSVPAPYPRYQPRYVHGLHRIQHCCVAVDPAPHRIRRRGHRRPRAGSAHLQEAPALGGHKVGPTATCRPSSALGPTQQHEPELDTSTSTLRHGDPSSHRCRHRRFSHRRCRSGRLGCGHLHPSGYRRRLPLARRGCRRSRWRPRRHRCECHRRRTPPPTDWPSLHRS
jgi:hypothetical protein